MQSIHMKKKDAIFKEPIRSGKLVIFGRMLISNGVAILRFLFAVFRRIWANGPLEQHDDL